MGRFTYNWKRVNWRLRNCEIQAMLGCSRQIVSRWRNKLRKPHPKNKGQPRRVTAADRAKRIPSARLRTMNVPQLASTLRISRNHASTLATTMRLPVRRGQWRAEWALVNWDLPNKDIARIWFKRSDANTLAHISRRRPHRARWDARNGGATGATYHAAVKQERLKARALWR